MKAWYHYQVNLILLAISFFSRLPVGNHVQYSPSKMRRASRYFPLVGWLLAAILALVYTVTLPLIGSAPSLCLLLVLSLLLTGALHEDGLADTCDGFWGGQSKESKLAIMKDSRIGAYGVCALVMVLLFKFVLLSAIAEHGSIILSLFIAYPLSRAMAISLMQDMQYVSAQTLTQSSKSAPLAKPFGKKVLTFILFSGALACIALPISRAMCLLAGCLILRYSLRYWMNKHINGYTGDCLGAAQQFQELFIYLIILTNINIAK